MAELESSIFDMTVDILLERQNLVRKELAKRFKKTKPFRMEEVPDEERIQDYLGWQGTPQEQEFRQQFGDEAVDKVHSEMHQLINRRMQNA